MPQHIHTYIHTFRVCGIHVSYVYRLVPEILQALLQVLSKDSSAVEATRSG